MAATGRAHSVGSGASARPWLDALAQLADDVDRPLEIRVPAPLGPAQMRLMKTLGVNVVVDRSLPPLPKRRGHRRQLPTP